MNLTNRQSIFRTQQLAKQIAFESDVAHGVYQGQPLLRRLREKTIKAAPTKVRLTARAGTEPNKALI
jgi:hypothetical protein